MSILNLSALALSEKIKAGEIKVTEVARLVLDQIKETEESIHSFVSLVDEDAVMKQAALLQEGIDKGELTSPLAGVPMAIKDNMCTNGFKTTC